MITVLGISSIGFLVFSLAVVSTVFFWRSGNIAYNPCTFNVYKDDYKHFIIAGILHSVGVAIFSTLQILSESFPATIARHILGSLQIVSSIPMTLYYHILVVNYKFRYLHIRSLGHVDYHGTYFLELVFIFSYVLIFCYALLLFQAELYYPDGMFSQQTMFTDSNSGWTLDNYVSINNFVMGIGIVLLLMDFFRVNRNSYKTYNFNHEPEDTTQFYFRKHISQKFQPHYINDIVTLFLPVLYLIVRGSPVMQLNGLDIFAKCLLIVHPLVFMVIYMLQIKLATRYSDKNEMECRCCVCRKKSMAAKNDSRLIRLKVMGLGDDGTDSEKREGAATEDEQPSETNPSTQTEDVEEF